MPSIRSFYVVRFVLIASVAVLVSGCGVTLSPVKRKPLQVFPMETTLRPVPSKVFVSFENTLPGQPLAETVWDNVAGPFANRVESKQIGFTQDYSKLATATVAGGAVAVAMVGTQSEYTRFVIPFGRIFEEVFASGVQQAFPNSIICSDIPSESEKLESAKPGHVVRLRVEEFRVWEKPLNHINMSAVVNCRVFQAGLTNQPVFTYKASRQATNQSIGSIMSTSSGFIREMNKISNQFAQDLSEEILENLQKNVGQ